MQWSQLKKRIEEQFAPKLRGRLEIRYTVYRTLTEGDGRAWFTWDGEQIYTMEDMPGPRKMDARIKLWNEHGFDAPETRETGSMSEARELLGVLHDYLRTPFEELLASPLPLERGLAMIDRRLGRRRFEKLRPEDLEQPFVKIMHTLRAREEGWLSAEKK